MCMHMCHVNVRAVCGPKSSRGCQGGPAQCSPVNRAKGASKGLGDAHEERWGAGVEYHFSRNLMSPTPRRKWYLTTGRRVH